MLFFFFFTFQTLDTFNVYVHAVSVKTESQSQFLPINPSAAHYWTHAFNPNGRRREKKGKRWKNKMFFPLPQQTSFFLLLPLLLLLCRMILIMNGCPGEDERRRWRRAEKRRREGRDERRRGEGDQRFRHGAARGPRAHGTVDVHMHDLAHTYL